MKKYFVSYDQAMALKGLGFDEECFKYYRSDEEFGNFLNYEVIEFDNTKYITNSISTTLWCDNHCTAPLKTQVFEWFRCKGWHCELIPHEDSDNWTPVIYALLCMTDTDNLGDFKSYEEAESEAIDKLIELLK